MSFGNTGGLLCGSPSFTPGLGWRSFGGKSRVGKFASGFTTSINAVGLCTTYVSAPGVYYTGTGNASQLFDTSVSPYWVLEVAGKLGMPETTSNLTKARRRGFWKTYTGLEALFDALGSLIHHPAAALLVASLVTEVAPPRYDIVACSFILVMQHWGVLFKYVHHSSYAVLMVLSGGVL